jgi:hypothetical protein
MMMTMNIMYFLYLFLQLMIAAEAFRASRLIGHRGGVILRAAGNGDASAGDLKNSVSDDRSVDEKIKEAMTKDPMLADFLRGECDCLLSIRASVIVPCNPPFSVPN